MYRACLFILIILFVGSVNMAQEDEVLPANGWQIFLERGIDSTGRNNLIFVNTLTGEETEIEHYGERYSIFEQAVMYFDYSQQRVIIAEPDGTLRDHPFIQPNLETISVDWVIDQDLNLIAWTLTNRDENDFLATITTVANLDGTNARQIITDGPRADGRRMYPMQFDNTGNILYMDLYLEGLRNFIPIDQYVNIFALDLTTGEQAFLPEDEVFSCFCGADFGDNIFLRLRFNTFTNGYDLHVYDLATELATVLDAVTINPDYLYEGDLILSDDERYAIYSLTEVNDINTPFQSTRTDFVLVDLTTMTQEILLNRPVTTLLRPVAWTENNTAILFTTYDSEQNGTWKVNINERRLVRIADANFIGVITSP